MESGEVAKFHDSITLHSNAMAGTEELAKHIKRLHSQNRLIGWELRRLAVHALVKDGSAEAMDALAENLVNAQSHQHAKLAEKALLELAESGNPRARDAFCRLLIRHKHPLAFKLVFGKQYTPSDPDLGTVFVRILSGWILENTWTTVDYTPEHVLNLLQKMAGEGNFDAQEFLCDLVVTHNHPQAREHVLAAGYAPRNPYQRAIFYVLTGQWEQYERFDFTHKLLPTAYKIADKVLQDRLAASIRQGGRADILASLVVGDITAERMSDNDWSSIIEFWHQNERWSDLWQLTQNSPIHWGMRIISLLQEVDWKPESDSEHELFQRLTTHIPNNPPIVENCWLVPCLAALQDYADPVKCFSFTSNGYILAYSYSGKILRLWTLPDEITLPRLYHSADMNTGGQPQCVYRHRMSLTSLRGHRSAICCLSVDAKNTRLASGDEDGVISLWSAGGSLKSHFLQAHSSCVNGLCFSSGGRFLLSSGADNTIRFWELHSEVCLRTIQQQAHYSLCIALSPSNKHIVSGDSDLKIRIWNISDGKLLHALEGHSALISCLALSPDGRFLLSGNEDGSIKLWDFASGKLQQSFNGHEDKITQLIISPDGEFFISAGGDRTLRIWELLTGRAVKLLARHSHDTTCIALSPNGKILLRADSNRTVQIWALNRIRVGALRPQQFRARELSLIQERLQEKETNSHERCYLNFLLELLRWQRRFDIEIGDIEREVPYTAFDIEIANDRT